MANIGTITKRGETNGLPILRGKIASMILETDIGIDPTGEVARNGAKMFAVRLKTPSGRPFDAGRAFANEIRMGENAGKTMWTIKIGRQPGIPEALELCAWPEDGKDDAWFLTMGNSEPAKPAQGGAPLSDEVPF